jgi:hypothetical protein
MAPAKKQAGIEKTRLSRRSGEPARLACLVVLKTDAAR